MMDLSKVKYVRKIGNFVGKNSSNILTIVAVGGLVTTVVLAVKATPKALELIKVNEELRKSEKKEPLNKVEKVKLTWKYYAPAVITGVSTVACTLGANSINVKRNAALASLYSMTQSSLDEYRKKVVEKIGASKELAITDDIAKDKVINNPSKSSEVVIIGAGEVLCYDSISGRYFKSNIEELRKIVNDFNEQLVYSMYASLNEFYYAIGLPGTAIGDELGWNLDHGGLLEVKFSSQLTSEGQPCLVLDYKIYPMYGYSELSY